MRVRRTYGTAAALYGYVSTRPLVRAYVPAVHAEAGQLDAALMQAHVPPGAGGPAVAVLRARRRVRAVPQEATVAQRSRQGGWPRLRRHLVGLRGQWWQHRRRHPKVAVDEPAAQQAHATRAERQREALACPVLARHEKPAATDAEQEEP